MTKRYIRFAGENARFHVFAAEAEENALAPSGGCTVALLPPANGAGLTSTTALPPSARPSAPARATAFRAQLPKGAGMSSTDALGAQSTQEPVVDPDRSRRTAGAFLPTRSERHAASWAGWFMAITFLTSIPALLLYHSILHDHNYILGTGSEGRVEFAAFLEVLLPIANIGVAVVMFPILKRQSERLALGYVASRIVESTVICVGLIALLSILTLRGDLAGSIGANGESLQIAGRTLVAIHDWTFLIGPGFCVGVNDLLLGYLMYTTALMPPRLAMVGIVGGPLIFASKILVVFGVFDIYSSAAGLFALPVFVFEASFAIYLIVQGFRPSHVLSGEPATT